MMRTWKEREREWSSEPGPKTFPWAAVTTATFSCGVEIMPIKRKLGAETKAYAATWDLVSWDATSFAIHCMQPLK